VDRVFEPSKSGDEVAHRRSRWAQALQRAGDWEEKEPGSTAAG
jgi:glycerol kinase